MEKEDLRKVLDGPTARYTLNKRLISNLALELPIPGYMTRGVDCLVNLTRHCNSMLHEPSSTQREEKNPVLSYAWQTFYPIAVDEELAANRVAVKKSVLDHLSACTSQAMTFEECNESNLINETLWSSKEWLLYRSGRPDGTLSENRREGGAASLIEYNCRRNPGCQLQDAVDDHLESRQEHDNLSRTDPIFIRVLYHAHAEEPRSYSDLLAFELPLVGGKRRSTAMYSLTAVVRFRRELRQWDRLRTYEITGRPVRPDGEEPSTWSVTAPGGISYLLVYVLGARDPDQVSEIFTDVSPEFPIKYQLVPDYKSTAQVDDPPASEGGQQLEMEPTHSNESEGHSGERAVPKRPHPDTEDEAPVNHRHSQSRRGKREWGRGRGSGRGRGRGSGKGPDPNAIPVDQKRRGFQ